jgi:hypothetical protein
VNSSSVTGLAVLLVGCVEPLAPPVDQDGDGYSIDEGDCNDWDSAYHPFAPELCGRQDPSFDCPGGRCADLPDGSAHPGEDQNCNGLPDGPEEAWQEDLSGWLVLDDHELPPAPFQLLADAEPRWGPGAAFNEVATPLSGWPVTVLHTPGAECWGDAEVCLDFVLEEVDQVALALFFSITTDVASTPALPAAGYALLLESTTGAPPASVELRRLDGDGLGQLLARTTYLGPLRLGYLKEPVQRLCVTVNESVDTTTIRATRVLRDEFAGFDPTLLAYADGAADRPRKGGVGFSYLAEAGGAVLRLSREQVR